MNFLRSSSRFVLLSFCIACTTTIVKAEYAVKIFFNNGIVDSRKTCTTLEWDKVQFEIQKATLTTSRRRRDLGTAVTASWCREVCSSIRYCLLAAPKCSMYTSRRRTLRLQQAVQNNETLSDGDFEHELSVIGTEEIAAMAQASSSSSSSSIHRQRELVWVDNTCTQDISILNRTINSVIPYVGSSCQNLLRSPRTFNCIDIDSCVIHNMDLWNADTDKLVMANFPLSGGRVCETNIKISFQAVTNYCVNRVNFNVWGPNNYTKNLTDVGKPFNLYGESGVDVYGEKLQRGGYTIHALADGNWSIVKTLKFDVINCAAIQSFKLWMNGYVASSNYNASTGPAICYGDYITFQAVTNAYATKVQFNIWGPVSSERIEVGTGDYFLYGDNGYGSFYDEMLPVGRYTMKAYTNDDYSTVKEVIFDVKNCAEIVQLDMWDADTDTILVPYFPADGWWICTSDYITFEAVTTSSAYLVVHFDLSGPTGTTSLTADGDSEYYLYGHDGYGDRYGEYLNEGNYNLQVWLNDDLSTMYEVNFDVYNC